jgi:uncharacterized membrane protein
MPNDITVNRIALFPLDRLVFLIDGVFAITLTLLVLDLKPPPDTLSSLESSIQQLLPRLAIYLFAFSTIANQWAIHHRTFRLVRHGNSTLVVLSLVNLLFITLIPVSAAMVGRYPLDPLAAAVFSINNLLLCLSAAAVWAYVAAQRQLLAEDTDTRILRGIAVVWLAVGLGFAVALAAGRLNVYAEYAVWLLWSPVVSLWWGRRRRSFDAQPLRTADRGSAPPA